MIPAMDDLDELWPLLQCPACAGALDGAPRQVCCQSCGACYPRSATGQLDLRLTRPVDRRVTTRIGEALPEADALFTLAGDPHPAVDLAGFAMPANVSPRLASYLPAAPSGGWALDVGCGSGVDRALLERAGYRWTGFDYHDERAPVLADAHALPFKDAVFDLLFSVAVIECFAHPDVAMAEAARVLRPGGHYLASIAFLSPYIPFSQHHYSHLGAVSLFQSAGFEVDRVMADADWTAVEASLALGLFPRIPRRVTDVAARPLKAAHRLYWRWGARAAGRPVSVEERVWRVAGDIEVVAHRPGPPPRSHVPAGEDVVVEGT